MGDLRGRAEKLYREKFDKHNAAELEHMIGYNKSMAKRGLDLKELRKHSVGIKRHGLAKNLAYKGMWQAKPDSERF